MDPVQMLALLQKVSLDSNNLSNAINDIFLIELWRGWGCKKTCIKEPSMVPTWNSMHAPPIHLHFLLGKSPPSLDFLLSPLKIFLNDTWIFGVRTNILEITFTLKKIKEGKEKVIAVAMKCLALLHEKKGI